MPGTTWSLAPATDAVRIARLGATTLMWMDTTRLRFRYVPGTTYPEGSPATTQDRSPASWVPSMVAAFNSGYKLSDRVGGFEYLGRTVQPLRPGLGAFTVTRDGVLSVGVWGRDLAMAPGVLVVRQNLPPLVEGGVVRASTSDSPRTWGIANGNSPRANRSALARLGDGSLVFAFAHDVTALQLARALVSAGSVDAVMLDMNRSWPTGFVYRHVGGAVVGRRIDPRIVRDPSTYLHPFKKDFVVVAVR